MKVSPRKISPVLLLAFIAAPSRLTPSVSRGKWKRVFHSNHFAAFTTRHRPKEASAISLVNLRGRSLAHILVWEAKIFLGDARQLLSSLGKSRANRSPSYKWFGSLHCYYLKSLLELFQNNIKRSNKLENNYFGKSSARLGTVQKPTRIRCLSQ